MGRLAAPILSSLETWILSLSERDVVVTWEHDPHSEFGPATTIQFAPKSLFACPLNVTVLEDGHCGFDLDSWSRLAHRMGVGVCRLGLGNVDPAALFVEPTALEADRVLSICQAVARGAVRLTVGLAFGRITATLGSVVLPSGVVAMHGVGGPLLANRLLRRLGYGDVVEVAYEPWDSVSGMTGRVQV